MSRIDGDEVTNITSCGASFSRRHLILAMVIPCKLIQGTWLVHLSLFNMSCTNHLFTWALGLWYKHAKSNYCISLIVFYVTCPRIDKKNDAGLQVLSVQTNIHDMCCMFYTRVCILFVGNVFLVIYNVACHPSVYSWWSHQNNCFNSRHILCHNIMYFF